MEEFCAIGIDIGGTKLRIGLVSEDLVLKKFVVTQEHAFFSPAELVDLITQNLPQVLEYKGEKEILGIGVGYPGPVSTHLGSTFSYTNLRGRRWDRVPLSKMIEEKTHLPTFLDNDANLAGLAEVHLGAGKKFHHIVYLTISTGMGGAIFFNRRLYRGFLGTAGEFGHIVVDVHGPKCKCGNIGCLMSLLSGLGLERLIKEQPACQGFFSSNESSEDCVKKLIELSAKGYSLALEVIQPVVQYFTVALLNIINILNPEVIVIGGALGKVLMALYLDEVKQQLHLQLPKEVVDQTYIRSAELGDQNGVLGGAILVYESFKKIRSLP